MYYIILLFCSNVQHFVSPVVVLECLMNKDDDDDDDDFFTVL